MTTFKLIQKIGEGSYSRVYKAISEQSHRTLAVKIISFKDAPFDYVSSRQLKILKELKHPNIANLLDCIVSQSSVYLVFQYYSMNLNQFYRYYQSQYNRGLDQSQIRYIMLQLCSALSYLHSLRIMHRDIKPENIMIDPATLNIKLIDFGFAKKISDDPDTGYMVTRWYRALQVVIGLKYDEKIDIFAAATIYLELIMGKEIFQSESNMVQLNKLLTICGYPTENSR